VRRTLTLIALGVLAFALSLVAFLPASLLGHFLPSGIAAEQLTGTLWNGGSEAVRVGNRNVGALRWKVHPLQLFRGRVALDAVLTQTEGRASAYVSLGLGGRIDVENLTAHWTIGALPFGVLPAGWSGDVEAALPMLRLDHGALQVIRGTIDARNLREPPPNGVAVGSYRVTFDETTPQAGKMVGQLRDTEGPMQVAGTITIGADRSYVIDGLVATRPSAPPSMVNQLRYLGTPDVQGRRPFSLAGTY
jgi:general secretion pathway protein N